MSYSPNYRGQSITTVANSTAIATSVKNNTANTILQLTPVRINNVGAISTIDVSNDTAASISGIMSQTTAPNNVGSIVASGIIKQITGSFVYGDVMYVSKTGFITNVKPNIGVGGFVADDYIIRIGVIAKNEDVPSLFDFYINISVVGRL